MGAELEMVLAALRAHDRGEGLRVNEICAALSSSLPTPRVIALLDAAGNVAIELKSLEVFVRPGSQAEVGQRGA